MTTDPNRRGPTLADRFIHRRYNTTTQTVDIKALQAIQARVRAAHRFVLDAEAITRVATVVRDIPELLVREIEFARAPFDTTWIEFPHWVYWLTLNDTDDNGDPSADHTVGYLVEHNRVNVVSGGVRSDPLRGCELLPIQYDLNTEWPPEAQREFAARSETSRLGIDQFLWGSSYTEIDPAYRRILRERNAVTFIKGRYTEHSMRSLIDASRGEMRTIIALLLMLNRPTVTRFANVLPGRGFSRGKLMPYLSHTTVQVDFDAVRTLRLIGTPAGEGVPRRRHEVRGHFCHDKTARDMMRIAGCVHQWHGADEHWTPIPETPGEERHRWVCSECAGRRWWKTSHERGDAGKGFVVKDGYDVTSAAERE